MICFKQKGVTVQCEECDFQIHAECSRRTDNGLFIEKWTQNGFKYCCPIHRKSVIENGIESAVKSFEEEFSHFDRYLTKFLKLKKIKLKEKVERNFSSTIKFL